MKKEQFVELVKDSGNYASTAEAEKAIAAFTGAIEEALCDKDSVSLLGFATFSTAIQKGREGKFPGTDRAYKTEDKTVPKVTFSKVLKKRVEDGK